MNIVSVLAEPSDESLVYGVKWGGGPVGTPAHLSYSFPARGAAWDYTHAYTNPGEPTQGFLPLLGTTDQQAVSAALANWSSVAGLSFQWVDDASADDVMAQLLCLESMDPDRDISIYINSPGGSYTAMTAIYDTMQFVRPHIQTVCLGQAASAAAVLLAAGSPGRRLALPNSRILIHQRNCRPRRPRPLS